MVTVSVNTSLLPSIISSQTIWRHLAASGDIQTLWRHSAGRSINLTLHARAWSLYRQQKINAILTFLRAIKVTWHPAPAYLQLIGDRCRYFIITLLPAHLITGNRVHHLQYDSISDTEHMFKHSGFTGLKKFILPQNMKLDQEQKVRFKIMCWAPGKMTFLPAQNLNLSDR